MRDTTKVRVGSFDQDVGSARYGRHTILQSDGFGMMWNVILVGQVVQGVTIVLRVIIMLRHLLVPGMGDWYHRRVGVFSSYPEYLF